MELEEGSWKLEDRSGKYERRNVKYERKNKKNFSSLREKLCKSNNKYKIQVPNQLPPFGRVGVGNNQ